MTETIDFSGDENIGVYTRVFEDRAFVPLDATEEYVSAVEKRLGVEVVKVSIQGSSIIGSLLAGNSHGMITSGLATAEESRELEKYGNVMYLSRTMNAAGNVILANDEFAVIHPAFSDRMAEKISEFLDVPVILMSVGKIPTIGMACAATNRGVAVSSAASRKEVQEFEKITELPVGKATINMGNKAVGTGLIANSKSYLAGSKTSGYELGRIEEIFSFDEKE